VYNVGYEKMLVVIDIFHCTAGEHFVSQQHVYKVTFSQAAG